MPNCASGSNKTSSQTPIQTPPLSSSPPPLKQPAQCQINSLFSFCQRQTFSPDCVVRRRERESIDRHASLIDNEKEEEESPRDRSSSRYDIPDLRRGQWPVVRWRSARTVCFHGIFGAVTDAVVIILPYLFLSIGARFSLLHMPYFAFCPPMRILIQYTTQRLSLLVASVVLLLLNTRVPGAKIACCKKSEKE